MKTLFLHSPSDVTNVPIGYTWQSKPVRASLWRLLLYALTSGDWNKVHINPITALLYRSNLGGLTYCADLVLSRTKEGVHRVFAFDKTAEIIASGYEEVEFKQPVRVGMSFYYRFILADRRVIREKAICKWRFEVLEARTDRLLYSGIWKSVYCPVEYSKLGVQLFRTADVCKTGLVCAPGIAMLAFLLASFYFGPSVLLRLGFNEYCCPLVP